MSEPINHYQILQVAPDAEPGQIKQAFRRLARRYHPDVAGQSSTAHFQSICEAYAILSDPARRQHFDQQLQTQTAPPQTDPKPQPRDPRVVVRTQPWDPAESEQRQRARRETGEVIKRLIKDGKLTQAVARAEESVSQDPGHAETIHWLAWAYYRLGSALRLRGDPQARFYLERAMQTEPENKELAFDVERELQRLRR